MRVRSSRDGSSNLTGTRCWTRRNASYDQSRGGIEEIVGGFEALDTVRLSPRYPPHPTPPETSLGAASPVALESESLAPLAERMLAARVRLWAGMIVDIGKAVGVVLWLIYIVIALLGGQPLVSV